jgi:hypothetical protein
VICDPWHFSRTRAGIMCILILTLTDFFFV